MANEETLGFETQAGSAPRAEKAKAAKKAARGAATTVSATADAARFLMPPQGAGAPRRLYSTGSPASEERFNVAMKILRDPMARASFSRVYSGQARGWNR
jgi:hypothetical protein